MRIDSPRVSDAPAQALGMGLRGPAALARSSCAHSAAALGVAPRLRRSARSRSRWRSSRCAPARRRASRRRRRSLDICADGRARARQPRARQVLLGRRPRLSRALRAPARPRRLRPRDETDVERVLEWCSDERVAAIPFGGGTSVVGGVTPHVSSRYNGVVSIDLARARPRARGRRRLARRVHPGRRARPAAGGAARRARPDAAPLPAVVRVLDARRLDRHARRRALRDAVDAHRGFRRVGARDHARGRVGVAAAARLGRRRQPRPHARRLRGHARRDHPGVGARAAAPLASQLRGRALRRASSRAPSACARSRSRACTRPTAACSTPARPR